MAILGVEAGRLSSHAAKDPSHPLNLFDSRRPMPAAGGLYVYIIPIRRLIPLTHY
jgi:hypothetical protein